jgi:hypothetical protein
MAASSIYHPDHALQSFYPSPPPPISTVSSPPRGIQHLTLSRPRSARSARSRRKLIRPTLLLRPNLLIMRLGMYLQLLQVRADHFLAAIGALHHHRHHY